MDAQKQFEELLRRVNSPEERASARAKATLQKTIERQLDQAVQALLAVIRTSASAEVKTFAANALGEIVNDDYWGNLSTPTQNLIKKELLTALSNESDVPLRMELCEVTSLVITTLADCTDYFT